MRIPVLVRPVSLLLCAASLACSGPRSASDQPLVLRRAAAVVGGEPATADEYPSAVALTRPDGTPFCTGTLVAPAVVVTAAHCIAWEQASQVRVVVGSAEPRGAPYSTRLPVASIHAHPQYSGLPVTDDPDQLGQSNDIGVLVLSAPVPNGFVTPVLAPEVMDSVLVEGADVHIVGYGIYDMQSSEWGLKYKAITPYQRRITWEMLAGSPGNPDTCDGDSGGPAYVVMGGGLYLAGATSRARPGAPQLCGDGGIYTLVPSYIDWIEDVAGTISVGGEDGGGPEAATLDAATLDADPACLPLSSPCNPVTNEGCDSAAGEACRLTAAGDFVCEVGPLEVLLGEACNLMDQRCQAGAHCGASERCERYCCAASDCAASGSCTALAPSAGALGTCGVETPDGGLGDAGGVDAESGTDAEAEPRSDEVHASGCDCRVGGARPGSTGAMAAVVVAFALALARGRRGRARR